MRFVHRPGLSTPPVVDFAGDDEVVFCRKFENCRLRKGVSETKWRLRRGAGANNNDDERTARIVRNNFRSTNKRTARRKNEKIMIAGRGRRRANIRAVNRRDFFRRYGGAKLNFRSRARLVVFRERVRAQLRSDGTKQSRPGRLVCTVAFVILFFLFVNPTVYEKTKTIFRTEREREKTIFVRNRE